MEKPKVSSDVSEATGTYGIQETSPDLLKNTPSNIARLEDVIEQCKGRQKYHAQTRSPSDGEHVRWYFCKVPLAANELAASVPRTDIVGKSEYFRFSMRDSLALEASFLQREEELLSLWWKEYAECSTGPHGRHISLHNKVDMESKPSSSTIDPSAPSYASEEERVGVPVKGGLYEVDLKMRHCFPVYWSGENRRILRGHWFARKSGLEWLPVREDLAEQLEYAYRGQVWHRRTFQPSGLFAARVDLQGTSPVCKLLRAYLYNEGLHALFTGEDDTWEAWLKVDATGFSSVIGLSGKGVMLKRGYSHSGTLKPTQDELRQQKEEEMDDYCSQVPVRHLVFMVHGIGQRLEKANLVDDVGDFRHITTSLAERQLTSYQRDTQRVLFIPCQWRKDLKLGGESAVENITLDGVKRLRVMLSATVHDVLYYMSPIYCQDIINSVSNQLNRLYIKFIKRNPGYDGKVSIYGHSLGSVLSYDILCHQYNLSSPFPLDRMYKELFSSSESEHDGTNHASQSISPMNTNNTNLEDIYENSKRTVHVIEEDGLSVGSKNKVLTKSFDHSSAVVYYSSLTEDVEEANSCIYIGNDRSSSWQTEVMQPNAGAMENYDREPDQSLRDKVSYQGHLDYATRVTGSIPFGDPEKYERNIVKDLRDKDKIIELLTLEVNSLRAKVTALGPQCGVEDRIRESHQGDKEVESGYSVQSLPLEVPLVQDNASVINTPYIKYTKLEFKVDTFFAVGSPLGLFLALRNIRIGIGKGKDYWQDKSIAEEMPCCQQMFNIFHPFDPVAYRVEPLVCKEYRSKRPVIIPYHRGGKRLHISFQEFNEGLAQRSQAVAVHLNSIKVKMLTICQSREDDNMDETTQEAEERSYGSIMIERLTGNKEGRIDHMLQDKTFQHPYISALGSHTNYWRDNDTALFILKHLYHDIPEEPNSCEQSGGESFKKETDYTCRFYQNETSIDEEFPLTFSDRFYVMEFSRQLRQAMEKP